MSIHCWLWSNNFPIFAIRFIKVSVYFCSLHRLYTAITNCESCERITAGEATPVVSNTRLNFMLRCFYTVMHASNLGKNIQIILDYCQHWPVNAHCWYLGWKWCDIYEFVVASAIILHCLHSAVFGIILDSEYHGVLRFWGVRCAI